MSNEKTKAPRVYKGQCPAQGTVKNFKNRSDAPDGAFAPETVEIAPDTKKDLRNFIKMGGKVITNKQGKKTVELIIPTPTKYYTIKDKPEQPLHRQARGYMKTTASLVGRDMNEERTLFDLPRFDTDTKLYKKTLSKNTAIAGHLCLAFWQTHKDDRGIYTIDKLKHFADRLGITPQELKIYLIYLGGYQRPITKLNIIKEKGKKEKRILSITHDKLFHIRFNIRLKDGETEAGFTKDDRVGTDYLNFIRDRDIYSVEISPSISLQEELQGGGLGNVLVDDLFVAFSLGLSDLAYKLFCLSGSNKPSFRIGFDKLVSKKYLNLETQLKGVYDTRGKRLRAGKGKPRILARIKEALNELLGTGHLTKWAYNEDRDIFSWTYSDKIIKHKALLPLKTEETGQDKTGL